MNVKNILESLGYKLQQDGKGWRALPLYRSSDNPTSLKIYPNGDFRDFSAGIYGKLPDLVALTLNLKDVTQANEWLGAKNYKQIHEEQLPKIETPIKWKRDYLDTFIKDHSYLESRGISSQTAQIFSGGVVKEDKMSGRYVIPIFDKDYIIGLVGRDITNEQRLKYKILGVKKKFVWPAHINKDIIKEKQEVILVESPMCVLKLYEAGIKNAICLWGVVISDAIICFLVGAQPKNIIISLNKDETKNNFVGEKAAVKAQERLSHFFNKKQIKIIFPLKKDFGEMSVEEIKKWYEKI
jgi:hypothetical protein